METGTWEGDTALEFGPAAAPRVLPLDGRATGISSALWSLGVVVQQDTTIGYFPQPSQFS